MGRISNATLKRRAAAQKAVKTRRKKEIANPTWARRTRRTAALKAIATRRANAKIRGWW